MIRDATPKVTQCLIEVKEQSNFPIWYQSDAILMQTAVTKYYIGIGQKMKTFRVYNYENSLLVKFNYPLIHIDPDNDLAALKCSTISGGKWMIRDPNDISLCPNEVNPVKGQHIQVSFG